MHPDIHRYYNQLGNNNTVAFAAPLHHPLPMLDLGPPSDSTSQPEPEPESEPELGLSLDLDLDLDLDLKLLTTFNAVARVVVVWCLRLCWARMHMTHVLAAPSSTVNISIRKRYGGGGGGGGGGDSNSDGDGSGGSSSNNPFDRHDD